MDFVNNWVIIWSEHKAQTVFVYLYDMKFSFEFFYKIFVFILYFHEIISIVTFGNYSKFFGNQIHILKKTKTKNKMFSTLWLE